MFLLLISFSRCISGVVVFVRHARSHYLSQPQEAGVDKATKRRALGPGGVRGAGVRSGEAGSAAVSREQRRSVASGASAPGSGAGGGGGAPSPVSGAGRGRSPNLANLCGSCGTRPWPRGDSGGGACARLGEDGGDGEWGKEGGRTAAEAS